MDPIVLIPGTLCDDMLWQHQKSKFSEWTDVIIADISNEDSIHKMARNILDNAPERFILAGLSLGGIVAIEIMNIAPERVLKLALLNSNPSPASSSQKETWKEQEVLTLNNQFHEVIQNQFIPPMLYAEKLNEQLISDVYQMCRNIGEKGFINQLRANANRPNGREVLPGIVCPTLIVGGKQDKVCTEKIQEEMSELIPSATLIMIENCGHLSTLDQPEAVTAVMEYWIKI
ncbi:alpha/beta fold hydrolase [Alkalicoccus daliensis]|uniref:Pimeloyl-ACP methyl ester carboxylesterase n=1 Tax=Alkalicoccus daliensis TaxID=745820 RepID=A0A1H0GCH4_9BACI|nr:alpha/beta hydrolase [Alkalicoccus daliensis]SDO04615.1 Pimeloyl-ACP methyl ester carboxylesterase [Alkalicoccus daliensis]